MMLWGKGVTSEGRIRAVWEGGEQSEVGRKQWSPPPQTFPSETKGGTNKGVKERETRGSGGR